MRDQILQSSSLMGTWHEAVEGMNSLKDGDSHMTQAHDSHRYIHNDIYNIEHYGHHLGHTRQRRVRRPYVGIVRGPGMVEDWADFTR